MNSLSKLLNFCLNFKQPGGPCVIRGILQGLTEGHHGIHILEYGDVSQGLKPMLTHFLLYGSNILIGFYGYWKISISSQRRKILKGNGTLLLKHKLF
mgnify:CR=1 FL=1